MPQDILIELGHLFLGSRLKRLAERFQGEAGRIMKAAGLPVQPVHFPLLAAIDRYGPLTITDAVEALGISQPAVTRTAGQLVEMGILDTTRDGADLRQKTLRLTEQGRTLMTHARAVVWPRVDRAVAEMCAETEGDILAQIRALEIKLDQQPLEDRVNAIAMPMQTTRGLRIRDYSDDLAGYFHRINAEWIDSMFVVEQNDIDILTRPRELIIDRGGVILFVEADGIGVIGTCALIRIADGVFELTKMGVSEAARGHKAGEFLLAAILERAREMEIKTLYLLTNSKCAPAIHLYEKLGFEHDAGIMSDYGARYERCNVAMLYRPSAGLVSSPRT